VPARGPGNRAGLTRDRVLAAARNILVEEGVDGLTMRHLALRLGVAPNSLYSHYADKAELMDAVLDALLVEVDVPDVERMEWRDGLVALMAASRALLLRHPALLPHLLSRPMRGPNASRLAEVALGLLGRGGVVGPPAVDALRALLTFTFGSVVLDAPRAREADPTDRQARSQAAFASHAELPRVAAMAESLARPPADEAFATSLGWLIEGIVGDGPPGI
jgi:TetR/AcrR family transcriptional regulator, tetracycline repressor protein